MRRASRYQWFGGALAPSGRIRRLRKTASPSSIRGHLLLSELTVKAPYAALIDGSQLVDQCERLPCQAALVSRRVVRDQPWGRVHNDHSASAERHSVSLPNLCLKPRE